MRNPSHLFRTALGNPAACLLAYLAIRKHYAVQSLWELTQLLVEMSRLRPASIFEIGTHRGGTLYCWSRVLPPDGTLMSLDLPADPSDVHTTAEALEKLIASKAQKRSFIRDDSHSAATLEKVKTALGGKPVDFLFIDGDHSYEGVKLDFEMYHGLVRSGGLVAFHDIAPNPEVREYGVARFWQELKKSHRTHEFIDPHPVGPAGMGIGVVSL